MNKKLVALAVAGVLAAPLAQAQTANVTLYGRVNLDVEFVHGKIYDTQVVQPVSCNKTFNVGDCITTNPWQYRLASNSSRFGLRGTESLGGGLNAIFQVESSINPAQSGGTLAGRESFVGLQGGWGTFKMGRFLAPYDDLHPIFGNVPTLTTSLLSTASLWSQGFMGQPNQGGFDDRVQNSVRYDSPNLSGFTFSVQYGGTGSNYAQPNAPIVTAGNTPHASLFGANALYNNGPISLGVGYEGHYGSRGRAIPSLTDCGGPCAPGTGSQLNDYAFSVAGAYSFNIVRIGAVYERLKYDAVSGGDITRNFWGVSLTGNLGPGQAYFFYGKANDGGGSAVDRARVGGLVKGADSSAQQWSVSYTYPLSKRTLTYVGYNTILNKSAAQYNFNINAYNPISATDPAYATPGGDPSGLVFGMVHFF